MDITLIVNPGSSSKKYALYNGDGEVFVALYERTEKGFGKCLEINKTRELCEDTTAGQYEDALHDMLTRAQSAGVIAGAEVIKRVGIRIVAPGTFFATHRVIDGAYMQRLQSVREAAPLHVPHQLSELRVIREMFPHARIIGVSDSAFHATMPAHARRYSISKKDTEAFDLYRFGYHGLSIASIVREVGKGTGRIPQRMIVCHIGSGMSVTALKDGKSVDTTMGFAPTSGLIMGTRAGEIDPSALIYLFKQQGNDLHKTESVVSEEGGLKGLLGNGDLRVALDRMSKGDVDAKIAVRMYIECVRKAIGGMAAVLGGVDMIILTGTAPERNPLVRKMFTESFEYLGAHIDVHENELLGARPGIFSTQASPVTVGVYHTAELSEIAEVTRVF
jgi:acetate kinase